jgi:hypothetical protein
MQPIRKVISATHFKQVPNPETENGEPKKWTPCSPGDPKAVEKAWAQIGSDELLEPPLKIADFLKSLDNTRPTVTQADIVKHEQWTMESGTCFFFSICSSASQLMLFELNCRKRWSMISWSDLTCLFILLLRHAGLVFECWFYLKSVIFFVKTFVVLNSGLDTPSSHGLLKTPPISGINLS